MNSRREFLRQAAMACGGLAIGGCATGASVQGVSRPNIVLIMTDDQGYGDLACMGNRYIKTPNLDRLYGESVRFTQFYVSPVCSPTRSSLMTGRYHYRTGVVDTFEGRSMMRPDEVTLAEMLSAQGYKTGIFGKWHLGDNYPMRAMDKGFQESLVHKGGGICQPSEPRNNSYFDPILKRNGVDVKCPGYCTDIFTNAAMDFIRANAHKPFFMYLPTNAPHDPLIVDEKYAAPYRAMGLDDKTAKCYGMVANIDENVGRLLALLRELHLEENTIVIFLSDNGPYYPGNEARFNAGMRDGKGTVYEGGIHVPFFVRWPGRLAPGRDIDRIAAHIDVAPTLLETCGIPAPRDVRMDGKSLWPLATGSSKDWPDRTLYFQWHRGDAPEAYRNCAARSQQYKLVNGTELYDLVADPAERKNIASDHPEIVARMRAEYDNWFKDVCARGFDPPKIIIGTDHENPTVLTRQDWRGAKGWNDGNAGYWDVAFAKTARYEIKAEFPRLAASGEARLQINGLVLTRPLEKGAAECTFGPVRIEKQDGHLTASSPAGGPATITISRR